MHREQIKALALANGFKLKTQPDGSEDLNPYVYEFAAALVDTLLPKASPGCFEVPRMCEVFSLPVYSEGENIVDQAEYFADCLTEKQAAVIAYAINNHDSMRAASLMSARDLVALNEKAEWLQAEVERLRVYTTAQAELEAKNQFFIEELEQERDQLKEILQQFMALNQHDRDLPLELFAIQRSVSVKAVSLANHDAEDPQVRVKISPVDAEPAQGRSAA
jgi:hypothetical protein